MPKLFKKKINLRVGSLLVGDLNCQFSVKKTLKPKSPNTCDLAIFNLSVANRKLLEQSKQQTVSLTAGYENAMSLIFYGQVRAAWTHNEGPDMITMMSSGDGEHALQTAQVSTSFGPSVPLFIVLQNIADSLGVGMGNVLRVATEIAAKGGGKTPYPRGTAFSGNAAEALSRLCQSADLEWSIQNGQIQILDLGKPLLGKIVEVSSDTGMIGSPSSDNKKVISFTTLMIPELKPGVQVLMNTANLKGFYRLETTEHKGEVLGEDWQVDCTAKVIK